MTIQNNKLNFTDPTTDGYVGREGRLISDFKLSGDFDIQVDFNIVSAGATEPPPESGQSTSHTLWFYAYADIGGEVGIQRSNRYRIGSPLKDFIASGNILSDTINAPAAFRDSSKLRLVNVNGNLTAYYWNVTSSQWEWNGDTNGLLCGFDFNYPSEFTVELYFLGGNITPPLNNFINANFDNFQINSADGIICP